MKRKISALVIMCILMAAVVIMPRADDFDIYEKTVRLHVIANSDTEEDQNEKLAVRDSILSYLSDKLENITSRDDAIEIIGENLSEIEKTANERLEAEGSEHTASVVLCREKYPRKQYDEITLPAGEYLSLQIKIGNSEGKNWWCVLFPTICTSAAEPQDKMTQAGFTTGQIRLITESNKPKYKLRFKLIEIIEDIFN